jgi:hypothetical protein
MDAGETLAVSQWLQHIDHIGCRGSVMTDSRLSSTASLGTPGRTRRGDVDPGDPQGTGSNDVVASTTPPRATTAGLAVPMSTVAAAVVCTRVKGGGQTLHEQTVLSHTAHVPPLPLKECALTGTRDNGVDYAVMRNVSALQPSLRRALAASLRFTKILRGLRKR